jgi:hypothetical protein
MDEESNNNKISDNEIKYLVLGWYIYEIILGGSQATVG